MGSETKFFCFRTFDSEAQIGLIEGLLDPQIGRSGNVSHFLEQRICIAPVSLQIVSHDLNIDGSRQAKIQNLADHVGRQESECHTRELFRECQTKLVNVVVRGMVIGGQSHKNVGIRCSDWSRIAVGEIDAAVGQTYVVNDALDFACWNLLSNRLLDLIAKVGGFFNAHSRGRSQMKFESAAVHAGKEVPAQPRDQNCQRAKTAREERNQENTSGDGDKSPAGRDSSRRNLSKAASKLF